MVSTLFAGLVAVAGLASALPQTTPSTDRSCQQLGSGSQVGLYTVSCGADRPGGDLSNAQASSFSACIPLCDQLSGCVGFAFTGGNGGGFCYFKSSLTSQTDAPNVDVAVKPVTSAPVTTTPAATTPAATTPAATTPAATTPAAPTSTAGPSCQTLGNGAQVGAYTTECQTDRPGGDLSNAQANSFSACIPLCDQLASCVGFSYVGGQGAGTCYFKSSLTPASANQGVDTAVKRVGQSSSSSSTSTAVTTTSIQVPTTTPVQVPTTTTRAVTTTPVAPTTTTRAATTSVPISVPGFPFPTFSIPTFPTISIPVPVFPTISIPSLPTTLSTTSRAATTTTRASTTTAAPVSSPTNAIFCTKYVFGVPIIVFCNTL